MSPADDAIFMTRALAAYSLPLSDEHLFAAAAQPFRGGEFGQHPASPEALRAALERAADALPQIECDFQAARLLLQCGTLVERGGPADAIASAVAERTRAIFGVARLLTDELEAEGVDIEDVDLRARVAHQPQEVRAHLGAHFAGLAAMACLCRDKPARIAARSWPGFAEDAEALSEVADSAYYLARLLRCVDDFVFEVIHLESRRGYRMRAEGIGNCFHLFTLIQAALIGDPAQGWLEGEAPDPELIDFATGAATRCRVQSDHARWHFAQWPMFTAEGLKSQLAWSIWGEASPLGIAAFAGTPTILLAPALLGSRSWNIGFLGALHDAHQSRVMVEAKLEPEQVEARLRAIAAANAETP